MSVSKVGSLAISTLVKLPLPLPLGVNIHSVNHALIFPTGYSTSSLSEEAIIPAAIREDTVRLTHGPVGESESVVDCMDDSDGGSMASIDVVRESAYYKTDTDRSKHDIWPQHPAFDMRDLLDIEREVLNVSASVITEI